MKVCSNDSGTCQQIGQSGLQAKAAEFYFGLHHVSFTNSLHSASASQNASNLNSFFLLARPGKRDRRIGLWSEPIAGMSLVSWTISSSSHMFPNSLHRTANRASLFSSLSIEGANWNRPSILF
ncbi:uncharacterized protein LOC130140427 [Syzygium oleosum]|uniref:uncharacterized protein LOC130140427 n=1 Tax=Syzygium oleosum TaxID=219896 RepID=UPI0024B8C098|nr:uncharacterized protein LOC130140427 [Syzygium oleosum]